MIIDSFSRWVVGWCADQTLHSRLAVAALEQAISRRQPQPGSFTTRTEACSMPRTSMFRF